MTKFTDSNQFRVNAACRVECCILNEELCLAKQATNRPLGTLGAFLTSLLVAVSLTISGEPSLNDTDVYQI